MSINVNVENMPTLLVITHGYMHVWISLWVRKCKGLNSMLVVTITIIFTLQWKWMWTVICLLPLKLYDNFLSDFEHRSANFLLTLLPVHYSLRFGFQIKIVASFTRINPLSLMEIILYVARQMKGNNNNKNRVYMCIVVCDSLCLLTEYLWL